MRPWIGVDLDGTLAEYQSTEEDKWDPLRIGKPIPKMVARIKTWLHLGMEVRIVTARVCPDMSLSRVQGGIQAQQIVRRIQSWLQEQGIPPLKVQHYKDYGMVELWDDRAVQVIPNTGERADGQPG